MRIRPVRWKQLAEVPHYIAVTLATLTLVAMTVLLAIAVFARYVLRQPIPGVTEVVGQGLMVIVIYLSLSSTRHVRVSLVVNRFPELARRGAAWLMTAVVLVLLAVAIYAAYEGAVSSYQHGEATSGIVRVPIYPFRYVVVAGLALTMLRVLQERTSWFELEGAGEDAIDDSANESGPRGMADRQRPGAR